MNIQHGNLYNSHDLRPRAAFGYCNHIPSSSETSFDVPLDHATAESNNLLVPHLMNECPTTNGRPPLYVPINSKGQPVVLSWQRDVYGNGGCSAAVAEANATCALDDRLQTIIGEIPPAPHSPSYGLRITVRKPLAIAIARDDYPMEGGDSNNTTSQQLLCPFCGNGVFVEGILENPTGSGPIASVPVDAATSEKSAAVFIEAPRYVLTSSSSSFAQGNNDDRNADSSERIFTPHATIREADVPPHLLSSLFPLRHRDRGFEVNSSCGHQYGGNSSRPSPAAYAYWARHNSLSNRYNIRKIASSSAFPPAEAEEAEAAASARLFDQTFEASSALYFVQKNLKMGPSTSSR